MIDSRNPDYSNTPASSRRPRFGYEPANRGAEPVVSIVSPFYNGAGPFFSEVARCILEQSFQLWEWIIVNDCATNSDALAALEAVRHSDPRIRVIDHPENRGVSAARNTGVAAARADYIMMTDDDDLLEPTTIEKLLWHLEGYPEAAVANGWSVGFGAQEYLWPQGFERGEAFLKFNLVTGRVMLRKSAVQACGGWDESIRGGMEDWDFWLRFAYRGLWGSTIPEYLDWYRRRPNHRDRWGDWDNSERSRLFAEQMRSRYPSLYEGGFPRLSRRPLRYEKPLATSSPFSNAITKSKPRVLIILPWMVMGGADKFNLDLVEQLTGRGWGVSIAATLPSSNTWMARFARFTPDIFPLHTFVHPSQQHMFLRYLIDSRQPDVVLVTNSEFGYLSLPFLRSACPGPAYVDYTHIEEEHWKNGGYPRYGVACQKLLDLNIVASQHLKDWMTKRGAAPDRVEVATINVDPLRWTPDEAVRHKTRRELGISDRKPVILYAGRLCPQKRPKVFAETMRRLAEQNGDFVALVAGDGEDRAWLEAFVAEHKLSERVRLRGEQSIDEMRNLILASDIFFLPSEWEGIALSIYEAMAAGLAVVGADVGGQRELVSPDCGILVPRTDVETETREYVAALERFLSDEALRRETGARARQRIVEHFALERMGERMLALFDRAIELSKSAPREAVSESDGLAAANQALELFIRDLEWASRPQMQSAGSAASANNGAGGSDGASPLTQLAAESELWSIENSRAWRTVQRLKNNSLYRAVARLRWGPDWDSHRAEEPPLERLVRVKSSNAYKVIQVVKRTPIYRWYALHKYGPDWNRQ